MIITGFPLKVITELISLLIFNQWFSYYNRFKLITLKLIAFNYIILNDYYRLLIEGYNRIDEFAFLKSINNSFLIYLS